MHFVLGSSAYFSCILFEMHSLLSRGWEITICKIEADDSVTNQVLLKCEKIANLSVAIHMRT